MSICGYCGRAAAIDEDLGECKFCGAPRYDSNDVDNLDGYIEETTVVQEPYPIETDVAEERDEYEREVISTMEAADRVASDMYTYPSEPFKKKRVSNSRKYLIGMLLVAIIIIPLLSGDPWTPPPPPPPTGGVYIDFAVIDSISKASVSGYEVLIHNSQTYDIVEVGVPSNGRFTTLNKYIHNQKILVSMGGDGVYCENFIEIVVNLNEQVADDGIYQALFEVTRLTSDIQLGIMNINGFDISEVFDKNYDFDVLMMAHNTVENSGYEFSYDLETGYAQEAFMFFEISTNVIPMDGDMDYIMQGPISTYLVFDVPPDDLTTDNSYYGYVDRMFTAVFPSSGNFTITYGVVLDGWLEMYLSMMDWGNNALIFEETFDIQVI